MTFTDPFSRHRKAVGSSSAFWRPSPTGRRSRGNASHGPVDPSRVIGKEERRGFRADRLDSTIGSIDGTMDEREAEQAEEKYLYSFSALKDKLVAQLLGLRSLHMDIENHFAPGACANAFNAVRDQRRPTNLRAFIVLLILVLIVFGALYTLVEYLLFTIRASACTVSTVFVPVTYTVTASSNASSASLIAPASGTSPTVPSVIYTSTSTQVVTSYVTLDPASSSSQPPYVYTVDPSGSTIWVNGVSPSSGVPLVTMTTSTLVPPTNAIESLTLPPYTSTEYSYVEPDVTLTSTSTSTNYVTYTLSQANPNITETRSSFSGIGTVGWNSSTFPPPAMSSASGTSAEQVSTTLTSVHYQSTGDLTTSTVTTLITTTISMQYTVTMVSSGSSSAYVTTITALPVTISNNPEPQPTSTTSVLSGDATASALSSISTTMSGSTFGALTTSMSSDSGLVPVTQISSTSWSAMASNTIIPANSSVQAASTVQTSSIRMTGTGTQAQSSPSSYVGSTLGWQNTTMTSAGGSGGTTQSLSVETTNTLVPAGPTTNTSVIPPMTTSISSSLSSSNPTASAASVPTNTTASVSSAIASTSGPISMLSTSSQSSLTSISQTAASAASSSGVAPAANTKQTTSSVASYNSAMSYGQPTSISSTFSTTVHSNGTSLEPNSIVTSVTSGVTTATGATTLDSSSMNGQPTTISTTSSGTSSSLSIVTSIGTTRTALGSSTTASERSQSQNSLKSTTGLTITATYTNATSISHPASSATSMPTGGCGEHGDFTIDFDNLPNFMPTGQNQTDITQAPPIQNPYHHLTFSDGYVYAPQPAEPYSPVSSPHLAVFIPSGYSKRVSTPFGNYSKPGEVSDGPRESISAFWFDALSAFMGCDNPGPEDCTLVLSAYTWSPVSKTEILADKRNATITACPELSECKLQKVSFPDTWRGLTGVQMQAFVGHEERMFFMDDLALYWSNNTCAAGLLRQSSR